MLAGQPPQLVAVPTHFFKAILGEETSGFGSSASSFVGAFVMPNQPLEPGTPLAAFAVPLSSLEEVSGALPDCSCPFACTAVCISHTPPAQAVCAAASYRRPAAVAKAFRGLFINDSTLMNSVLLMCKAAMRPTALLQLRSLHLQKRPTAPNSKYVCAGLRFFPQYLDDERRYALDAASLGWQRQGREQMAQLPSMGQPLDGMLSSGSVPGGVALI